MATFTNQASLAYNNVILQSNVVTGTIVDVITGNKTLVNDNYERGSTLTYVINLMNSSQNTISNISLTDDLGAYTNQNITSYPLTYVTNSLKYFQNGILNTNAQVTNNNTLQISNIEVLPNGVTTLVYDANVNSYAPLQTSSTITNNATVTNSQITTPLVLSSVANVSAEPNLSISKDMTPQTITEGSTITYTFIIENSGNTPITDDTSLTLTDTFNPVLSNITVSVNDNTLDSSSYTYNTQSGFLQITSGITVDSATYTVNTDNSVTRENGITKVTVTGTI